MEARQAILDAFDGLIDARALRPDAPADTGRQMLRRVIAAGDESLLDALVARTNNNLRLVPRTPAFYHSGAVPIDFSMGIKRGELALVYDRLVLFAQAHWTDKWERVFVVSFAEAQIEWWKKLRGGKGFTLRTATDRYRISLMPPRSGKLTEISAPSEQPTAMDGIGSVVGLLGKSEVLSVLEGLGELFAYERTGKIASVHTAMWKDMLSRVAEGERPPFGSRQPEATSQNERRSPSNSRSPETKKGLPTVPVRRGPGERRNVVLRVIDERPGVTTRELSAILGVEPSALYPLLRRLEDEGLIGKEGRPARLRRAAGA